MFNFLKEKLKGAFEKITKRVETPEEKPKEEPKVEKPIEEKPKETKKEEKIEIKEAKTEVKEEKVEEKKGFFGKLKEKITTTKISESGFQDLFWDLELAMLENNVAVEVIEKIKIDLKTKLIEKPIKRGEIVEVVKNSLRESLEGLFVDKIDVMSKIKSKRPFVICFFGINGSGKTTTIAKFANMLQDNKLKCVLAAADTFRAAAIDQLQEHADKLKVKLIKQDYGSDPAAVAFDAIKHAEAKGLDVVLIDTAGRMHSNKNLLDEMKKIIKVAKPDLKIFVGEALTGNDCIEQAKEFNESVGIDGIVLSKADVDEKGGTAISISHTVGKPILYLGVGQQYKDLKEFDSNIIINAIGL